MTMDIKRWYVRCLWFPKMGRMLRRSHEITQRALEDESANTTFIHMKKKMFAPFVVDVCTITSMTPHVTSPRCGTLTTTCEYGGDGRLGDYML